MYSSTYRFVDEILHFAAEECVLSLLDRDFRICLNESGRAPPRYHCGIRAAATTVVVAHSHMLVIIVVVVVVAVVDGVVGRGA